MKELIDYRNLTNKIRDKSIVIVQESGRTAEAVILKKRTDEVLEKTTPSIMFYGLYNAGKSSIINAIFGQEIAPVGDIPTTTQVQTISWRNFIIIDTPGINAKNEHTLVAEQEIDKHDVILFVIDDMSIEEKSFYSAFITVLKHGKPVLIVINQKNADDCDLCASPKIQKLKTRIVENIQMAASGQGISDAVYRKNFYGIIPVNAMTAYTAKQLQGEDAELLYQESGLEHLIVTMQDILRKSNGVKMMLPAISMIESELELTVQHLKTQIQSKNQKNYVDTMDQLSRQKNNLYQRLVSEGKNQIMEFGNLLSQTVVSGGAVTVSQNEISQKLNNIIKNGFRDANVVLQQQYELYTISHQGLQTHISKEDFEIHLPENTLQTDSDVEIINMIQDLSGISSISDSISTESMSKMKKGSLAVPVAAGAATAAGLVDPLITVPIIIYTLIRRKKKIEEQEKFIAEQRRLIDENNQKVEEKINQMISQIVEINNRIRTELFKLEESYTNCVSNLVESSFAPLIEKLKQEYDSYQEEKIETESYLMSTNELLHEAIQLKLEISQ